MKIKTSSELDATTLAKVKAKNLAKAKAVYKSIPFATKVYVAMQLKMPIKFIVDNWQEITGGENE